MATRRKVENDIIETLCCFPKRCLPKTALEQYLELKWEIIEEALEELVRNKVLRRKRNIYCYPITVEKKPRPTIHEKRLLVGQFVSEAKEPPTTAEIAKATGLESKNVYPICKRFEEKGLFKKGKKPREKPLYYAPIINQTLHTGNYNLITKLNKELTRIIRKYELKDPRMKEALQKFFKSIARQYPRFHDEIISGMEKLFSVLKRARSKEEVLELLGLRPSYPEICTWGPGPGN